MSKLRRASAVPLWDKKKGCPEWDTLASVSDNETSEQKSYTGATISSRLGVKNSRCTLPP